MKNVLELFVLTSLVTKIYAQLQSQCTTPNKLNGKCISIYDCEELLTLVNNRNRTPAETKLIRDSHCGYTGNNPLVCCAQPEVDNTDRRCFTPDGKEGTCIGLYSCPHLKNLLQRPASKQNLNFVQSSRCEGPDQYSVCCGPGLTPDVKPSKSCSLTAAPPDPRTECCGLDSSNTNKIFGGNATLVDQYAWLTVIEYRGVREDKIFLMCGGALISGKYVLTAGHCVIGPILKQGKPINVRLGEYDTNNDGIDCIDAEGGGRDCTEGTTIIPIEKSIPHPGYDPMSKLRRHDIALLRLQYIPKYSDFIKPICLPMSDITQETDMITLYAAGWGAVDEYRSSSNVKLFVGLPYYKMQDCQKSYNTPSRKVALWEGQMCAGGEKDKDTCRGDSGGPLMYENDRVFEVVGVVSFGPTPCGMERVPGVYTKVFHYIPWLRSQMKP